MRVSFHAAALGEFAHEVEFYAAVDTRLGDRFATAVEQAVALAAEFPEMGSPYKDETRRVFTKRFPFAVIYLHRGGEIFVVAIAPDNKKPGYWRRRIHA